MNRRTFDPDAEPVPLGPHGHPPAFAAEAMHHPCRLCGTATLRTTLSLYGARCYRCFEAYCGASQVQPGLLADKAAHGSKAWAWALKAREESSPPGTLTFAQRELWRAALAPTLGAQAHAEGGAAAAAWVLS